MIFNSTVCIPEDGDRIPKQIPTARRKDGETAVGLSTRPGNQGQACKSYDAGEPTRLHHKQSKDISVLPVKLKSAKRILWNSSTEHKHWRTIWGEISWMPEAKLGQIKWTYRS
jgi:hypothetical protein